MTTTAYSAQSVFDAFLLEMSSRGLAEHPLHDRKIHRSFYMAAGEFPEAMGNYEFLVRMEPYSQTLERIYWESNQAGILLFRDGKAVLRNPGALEAPGTDLKKVAVHIVNGVQS